MRESHFWRLSLAHECKGPGSKPDALLSGECTLGSLPLAAVRDLASGPPLAVKTPPIARTRKGKKQRLNGLRACKQPGYGAGRPSNLAKEFEVVLAVGRAGEEEVLDCLGLRVTGGASCCGRFVDAPEVMVKSDMSHPELDEKAGMASRKAGHEVSKLLRWHERVDAAKILPSLRVAP
ncbi:hypothetical protein BKA93DRAFT_752472 [Sparassis latifolia]